MPLVEIVSKPDMNSSEEAKEYLKKVHEIIRALGVSSADMEKGQMRLEPTVNAMIEKDGETFYTPLAEIKNINSFNYASAAIDYEVKRQVEEFEKTGVVKTATNKTTRGYDAVKKITFLQRSKEEAKDYRYFPEPDIPPFVIEESFVEGLKNSLPLLPDQITEDLLSLGVEKKYGKIISIQPELRDLIYSFKDNSEIELNKLSSLIVNGKIDLSKDIVSQYQELTTVGNTNVEELSQIIKDIISSNPGPVAEYKKGKINISGFFVGQAMKQTQGKADPQTLSKLTVEILNSL